MSDNKDDNTIVLDLGGYGAAAQSIDNNIYIGSGSDTITFDSSTISTITLPSIGGGGGMYNTGDSGGTFTIGGGGGGYYTTNTSNYTWGNVPNNVHINADGLTMKEGSDIKIGDKSLVQSIEKIEERLGILKPNPELEERWEKLKDLRKQYMELEKDLLEKEKIMKILKET